LFFILHRSLAYQFCFLCAAVFDNQRSGAILQAPNLSMS
jgi:hypothetical protein